MLAMPALRSVDNPTVATGDRSGQGRTPPEDRDLGRRTVSPPAAGWPPDQADASVLRAAAGLAGALGQWATTWASGGGPGWRRPGRRPGRWRSPGRGCGR